MSQSLGDLVVNFKANTADLKAGITSSTAEMKAFSKAAEDLWSKNAQSIKGAGSQLRSFGGQVTMIGTAMTGMTGIAVKVAGDLEGSLMRAAYVAGNTGTSIQGLQDKLRDLAKELTTGTIYSAKDATDAFYNLADKGFDFAAASAKDLIPIMNLATATGYSLSESAEVTMTAIRAFGLQQKDSARLSDVFTNILNVQGMSLQELQSSLKILGPVARLTGVSVEEIALIMDKLIDKGVASGAAMQAMKKAMADLTTPSTAMIGVLGELNLTVDDVSLKTKTFNQILATLDAAGASSAQIMTFFGDRAGPVVAQLMSLEESGKKAYQSINDLTASMKVGLGGEAANAAAVKLKSLDAQAKMLKESTQALLIELGTTFLPVFKSLTERTIAFNSKLLELAKNFPEVSKAIGTVLMYAGPLLLAIGAITIALGTFLGAIGNIVLAFKPLAVAFATWKLSLSATQLAVIAFNATLIGMAGAITLAISGLTALGVAFVLKEKAIRDLDKSTKSTTASLNESYRSMEERLKSLYNAYRNENEALDKAIKSMDLWIAARKKATDEAMKDGKITLEEAENLDKFNERVMTSIKNVNELGRAHVAKITATKDSADSVKSLTTAEEEAQRAEAQRLDLQRQLGIEGATFSFSIMQGADALTKLSDEAALATMKLKPLKDELDKQKKILDIMGVTEYKIKIDFTLAGAAEFTSVEQEILRLEHQIQMEKATTSEKALLQIKQDLEQSLFALSIKRANFKVAFDETIARLNMEKEEKAKAIRDEEGLTEELKNRKIKAVEEAAAARIAAETQIFNATNLEHEKIRKLEIEFNNLKLENAKKAAEANKGEKSSVDEITGANKTATQSYVEREQAARAAAQAASQPALATLGSISRGATQFASWADVAAARESGSMIAGHSYQVAGYQRGTVNVPRTGLYRLHAGEAVIPAPTVRSGADGINLTIINKIDSSFVNEMLDANPNTVINIIGEDIARGGTIKKSVISLTRKR